ncbi:MAG: glycosyltransferase family 39 protein [Flavobacteriales bacterium]|nr:glycosyltransferase family 39 protein [Flavobacteriales bacterium]
MSIKNKSEEWMQRISDWTGNNATYICWFFIILSFCLRMLHVGDESLHLDEAVSVYHSQQSPAVFMDILKDDPNPPLFNLLIAGWVRLFGVSLVSARIMCTVLNALTIGVFFLFLRKNAGGISAILGASLLTFSNLQLAFSHDARSFTLVGFLAVISMYLFMELFFRRTLRKTILFAVVNSLLMYTHYASVFLFVGQFMTVLLCVRDKKTWYYYLGSQLGSVLLFAPWLKFVIGVSGREPSWIPVPRLLDIRYIYQDFLNGYDSLRVIILITLLAGIFFIRSKWRSGTMDKDRVLVILMLGCGYISVIAAFAFSQVKSLFLPKYLMYTVIGQVGLLAVLLGRTTSIPTAARMAGAAAVLWFYISAFNVHPTKGEDWKHATSFIKSTIKPGDAILVAPWCTYLPFTYYYDPEAFSEDEHTIPLMNERDVFFISALNVERDTFVRPYQRVFYVEAHQADLGGVGENISGELKRTMTPIIERLFPSIKVRLYENRTEPDSMAWELLAKEVHNLEVPLGETHWNNENTITDEVAFEGSRSSRAYSDMPYGICYTDKFDRIYTGKGMVRVVLDLQSMSRHPVNTGIAVQVIDQSGNKVREEYFNTDHLPGQENKWLPGHFNFALLPSEIRGSELKIFVYNPQEEPVYVDNFEVKIYGEK